MKPRVFLTQGITVDIYPGMIIPRAIISLTGARELEKMLSGKASVDFGQSCTCIKLVPNPAIPQLRKEVVKIVDSFLKNSPNWLRPH